MFMALPLVAALLGGAQYRKAQGTVSEGIDWGMRYITAPTCQAGWSLSENLIVNRDGTSGSHF
jgi:hypothetical protein